MAQLRTSRVFDVIFLALLGVLIWWAAVNRVAVGDWIYFLRYEPSSQVETVAKEAGLSDAGRRLFYRTDPTFADRATVTAACDIERLGCIDEKGRVFILDEPGQHATAVVTAAHEMLHLAYRRLTEERKAALALLLDEGVRMNRPEGIDEQLANEQTTADRREEAHSYLGSEYTDLPEDLEHYYAEYFSDRSKVLAAQAISAKNAR
jgi:hypothetical protein